MPHYERGAPLPQAVKDAFREMSEEQRYGAENTMIAIQFAFKGGVLNAVVERAGDILNRMNKDIEWTRDFQYLDVLSKLETVLRSLRHPYGFRREMAENITNNALTLAQRAKLGRLMRRYAEEFAKLPAYNRIQYVAREGAIAIGCGDFERAERYYTVLEALMSDRQTYVDAASQYRLGRDGEPLKVVRKGKLCR